MRNVKGYCRDNCSILIGRILWMCMLGIIAVVFTVLKLTGVIDWSWVYVLMPIIIPTVMYSMMAIVLVVLVNSFLIIDKIKRRNNKNENEENIY